MKRHEWNVKLNVRLVILREPRFFWAVLDAPNHSVQEEEHQGIGDIQGASQYFLDCYTRYGLHTNQHICRKPLHQRTEEQQLKIYRLENNFDKEKSILTVFFFVLLIYPS
jgi:hypothetical protein